MEHRPKAFNEGFVLDLSLIAILQCKLNRQYQILYGHTPFFHNVVVFTKDSADLLHLLRRSSIKVIQHSSYLILRLDAWYMQANIKAIDYFHLL